MVSPRAKMLMMTGLVAAFAVQTGLVYSDTRYEPLSEEAVRGREIFHDYGCQSCHQLYGQGGFLGPDLTNAWSRVDSTRLHSLLTVGSGPMPAFGLSDRQVADVAAFLQAMDRPEIGRGQLRLGHPGATATPGAAFEAAVEEELGGGEGQGQASTGVANGGEPGGPTPAVGFQAFRSRNCSACHQPFRTSPVGAPDLSTVVDRLSDDELRSVLTDGRPTAGMPPPAPAFDDPELEGVIRYFHWLRDNRGRVQERTEALMSRREVDWSALPWWEFP